MDEVTDSPGTRDGEHAKDKYPYIRPEDLDKPEHLVVDAEDVEDFIEHFSHHEEHEKAHAEERAAEIGE